MTVLESCPKHNMVTYLEKTDGNTEFHEIISFLKRSSIHYALTQNWKIVSWKLHSSLGIHTIMTDEGIVIHMLVENKYPLKKEVLL
ncbi:hypothetical protein Tco_0229733, partial [Tanacetum coccineum]